MKNVSVWSRSRLFLPGAGAGADPIWSEPESAPGPRTSGAGAAKKSGGSATLIFGCCYHVNDANGSVTSTLLIEIVSWKITFKCVFLTLDHDHDFTIIIDPWMAQRCVRHFFVELGTRQICCFSDK